MNKLRLDGARTCCGEGPADAFRRRRNARNRPLQRRSVADCAAGGMEEKNQPPRPCRPFLPRSCSYWPGVLAAGTHSLAGRRAGPPRLFANNASAVASLHLLSTRQLKRPRKRSLGQIVGRESTLSPARLFSQHAVVPDKGRLASELVNLLAVGRHPWRQKRDRKRYAGPQSHVPCPLRLRK